MHGHWEDPHRACFNGFRYWCAQRLQTIAGGCRANRGPVWGIPICIASYRRGHTGVRWRPRANTAQRRAGQAAPRGPGRSTRCLSGTARGSSRWRVHHRRNARETRLTRGVSRAFSRALVSCEFRRLLSHRAGDFAARKYHGLCGGREACMLSQGRSVFPPPIWQCSTCALGSESGGDQQGG